MKADGIPDNLFFKKMKNISRLKVPNLAFCHFFETSKMDHPASKQWHRPNRTVCLIGTQIRPNKWLILKAK